MKNGVSKILGKTITNVVVASKEKPPRQQVFLVFSDGTYFEFYGAQFNCAAGIDRGGVADAVKCAEGMGAKITNVYSARPL